MKLGRNQNILIVLLVVLIVLETGMTGLSILSISPSYTTGYQGAKARFVGVQHQGKRDTNSLWGTTLGWDADTRGGGDPPIAGEMTSVFVPQESVGTQPQWIPSEWLLSASNVRNPTDEWEWEIPVEGSNKTRFYRMEEWKLKWYFSISSEPTEKEIPSPDLDEIVMRNSLKDVKVWFQFDLTPTWYFEGATNAYFAIAELRISDIAIGGVLHKQGGDVEKDESNKECRVVPASKQSILTLYYGLFGMESNRAEQEAYDFRGKKLNPDLFTDKVYSYFTLDDFGVTAWWAWGRHWRGDTVTVAVDFVVFVIGEWVVQDVQNIPDEYGRGAKTAGTNFLAPFGQFLASPEGRLTLLLVLGAIIFLFLAIFASPFLTMLLMGLFGGRRRRR